MPARRSYGSGSLTERAGVYYGRWHDGGRRVQRRIGPVRTPHKPDGLTKTQAEARLRDLIREEAATAPVAHARTLEAATDAWIEHLEANGTKASSVRAYRAALDKWFLPTLKTRSLDRITTSDVEHAMARMRKAELSDKTIRNYVGVLRALFNFAADKRRRWTTRNPVDDIELPRLPTYGEIRYLTKEEIRALIDAVRPVPITGTDATYEAIDKAMIVTAAMTGLRIGELQASTGAPWTSSTRACEYAAHGTARTRRSPSRRAGARSGRSRCPTRSPVRLSDSCAPTIPAPSNPTPTRSCSPTPSPATRWATKPCTTAYAKH